MPQVAGAQTAIDAAGGRSNSNCRRWPLALKGHCCRWPRLGKSEEKRETLHWMCSGQMDTMKHCAERGYLFSSAKEPGGSAAFRESCRD